MKNNSDDDKEQSNKQFYYDQNGNYNLNLLFRLEKKISILDEKSNEDDKLNASTNSNNASPLLLENIITADDNNSLPFFKNKINAGSLECIPEEEINQQQIVINRETWKHNGCIDLIRRFFLSNSKIVSLALLSIILLETFSATPVKNLNSKRYLITMACSLFAGGLIEPILSFFPSVNKKYLPIFNGIFQGLENIILKIKAISIFFCGYHEVPSYPTRFLPSLTCVQSHKNTILILTGLLMPFSILSGYMEFDKYKNKRKIKKSFLDFLYRPACKTVLAGFNASMSLISLITVVSMSVQVSTKEPIPLVYELLFEIAPAFLAAALAGWIENNYCKYQLQNNILKSNMIEAINLHTFEEKGEHEYKYDYRLFSETQSKSNSLMEKAERNVKKMYIFNEFSRPSLGTFYCTLYFALAIIPNLNNNSNNASLPSLLIACLGAILLNTLRSYDTYYYKFIAPAHNQPLSPVINEEPSKIIPNETHNYRTFS